MCNDAVSKSLRNVISKDREAETKWTDQGQELETQQP